MDCIVHSVTKSQMQRVTFTFFQTKSSKFLRDYISSSAPKIITRKIIQTRTGFIPAKCLKSIWYILAKGSINKNRSVTISPLQSGLRQ